MIAGEVFSIGYVEAVATLPDRQRQGLGSGVMKALQAEMRTRMYIGVLSTGATAFDARLGWERWRGSYVVRRTRWGRVSHRREDEGLMALWFGPSARLGLTSPIVCFDRPGDVW